MNMVWFLSLLLCILGISEGASRTEVVKVGAIFSLSSVNGKVSKIAIEAAEKDVNSDPSVLGGRKLSISIHDANYSGFLGITGAMKYMVADTVAILGPQDATMGHILSHLSNELHVPLLSFTALDPTLSTLQYPYFIQTAPNDQFQMTAIADMISYHGWHDVVVVFTDDDQCRNSMFALGDKIEEKGLKIPSKVALPPYPTATRTEVHNVLVNIKMMESRVIVLYTFSKTGFLVFEMAKSLGMMEAGYVWITSSWLSTVIDSTSPLPLKTANSIQGVLTLRLHTPESKRKRSFISRWNELSNGSIGLNTYGLYAYDTVWMIARGLKELFDQNGTISFSKYTHAGSLSGESLDFSSLGVFNEGNELLNNLLNISMIGLTGPIQFQDRYPLHPSYDILNVVKSGMKRIGYWSNHSGLSVEAPETLYGKAGNRTEQLGSTVWPGGLTTKPRGWVLPLDGRRLRIGVPRRVSYQEFVTPGSGNETIKGYCIDVFAAAVKLLPYAVNYEFVLFGDGKENPSYFELVNNVALKEFDAAVGDIAIVTSRTKIVDFTQPYIESGLIVLARVKNLNSSPLAFLRPFTPMLWIVSAAFFLLIGLVVWILERRDNDEFQGHPRKQFVTILWFGFSTMFFAQRENVMSTPGRFVLVIWLFVVLIINSSYTASLTSIFTVQLATSPITGIDSLISTNVRIGFQVGSFAESYLSEQLNVHKSRLIALGSPQEYAAALKNGTVGAIVDEQPYIDVFLAEYCDYSTKGQQFTKSGWGFAFPRDSPLAGDLSTAILALSENGGLQKIHDQWFSRKSCSSGDSNLDQEQLHLQSFIGLFSICAGVCFFALFLHFFLTMCQFNRHLKQDPEASSNRDSNPTRLRKFLSFADTKRGGLSKRKIEDTFSSERGEN
ncbi:glutamate receptor 3.2-like isoform X1 [Cucurbita maxima]|uniref:Glutamate receptor n=1 Tax=Cucurbita maxima TaxID=3661 RepID=A0A6J1I157_CUCMA|nr:glutamate receptor 3.2-like isoform X1 [Cucurbita maxima]XP_022968959.1 glutamate receptor 3.2-like isoform X1 [Cucurbita maxima]